MRLARLRGVLDGAPAALMTAGSFLRIASVGMRALLTVALAVWLQPSDLGLYGLTTATLALTAYFYGLEFHIFAMREISMKELADARRRIRDQFALLLVIYVVGSLILALLLMRLGVAAWSLLLLISLLAVAQHAALELYRILTRMNRMLAATLSLMIRDGAWVPICFLIKLVTGELSLVALLWCWLGGSILSVVYGVWSLARWLPTAERQPIDLVWLRSGLRTGLRMLVGSLAVVGLFSVDRMIFAASADPDELGAYALFAMACASLQGVFETAILPHFWTRLLEAEREGDIDGRRRAERKLQRACLIAAIAGGALATAGCTVLVALLPHPAYAANLHLLYPIVVAYSLLTIANIPHYRLFASKRDSLIVTANVAAFVGFVALAPLLVSYGLSVAVPLALALSTGLLVGLKWLMVRTLGWRSDLAGRAAAPYEVP